MTPPSGTGPRPPAGEAFPRAASPSGRAGWGLLLTALLFTTFLACARALLDAALPRILLGLRAPVSARELLLSVLPLLPFLAPALGLGHRWGREAAIRRLAAVAALSAPLAALLQNGLALVCAGIAVAAAGSYLGASIGYLNRRAVAAGVAAGIVLEHVLRTAATSLVQGGLPAALVFAGLGVTALSAEYRWRSSPDEERRDSLERRAGGLRLRGGIGLGTLLYLDARMVAPDGSETPVWFVALLVAVGLATCVLLARGLDVYRHRMMAVGLGALAGLGALLAQESTVGVLAPLWLAGHGAALLLLDRALAPVSGRRSGWNLVVAFGMLIGFELASAGWSFTLPFGAASGWLALAGLLALAATYLTPRPVAAASAARPALLLPVAAAVQLAALLALVFGRG